MGQGRAGRNASSTSRGSSREDSAHSVVSLFPNAALLDVLAVLLLRPDQEFYQREIVEETGHKLLQVQRALGRIERAGLLERRRRGNRVYYVARRSHPAFPDFKAMLLKTVALGDALRAGLSPLRGDIEAAFVYGSVAAGAESSASDVDLFMVGAAGSRTVAQILGPLGRQLGRECNLVLYTAQEYRTKVSERHAFVREVIDGPKIWLIGSDDVLAALAE